MAQQTTPLSPEPGSGLPGDPTTQAAGSPSQPATEGPGGTIPQGAGVLAVPAPRGRGFRVPQFLSLLISNRKSLFGLVVLGIVVLMAVFAPLITRHGPSEMFLTLPGQPPSPSYPFGTNQQGQDLFAQVLYGARASLFIGAAAAALATFISAALGMIAAYVGGVVDEGINLLFNIFLVLPALVVLIVIATFVPARGTFTMIFLIAGFAWAGEARVLRSQALSLRSRDFVLAAATSGESVWRIVFGEVMPNMTSRIAAGFIGSFVFAIIYEASLEFLGFGNPSNITWGNTLFWAQNNSSLEAGQWWHFLFPGLAIAITATALIFINYGIDELSNPRLQRVKIPKEAKAGAKEGGERKLAAAS